MLKSETLYPTLQEEIGPAGPFMTEYRIELYQSASAVFLLIYIFDDGLFHFTHAIIA